MAAVELGADLHVELAPSHRLIGELGIRRRGRQVAPKAHQHLAPAAVQGLERLVDVVPRRALEPHREASLKAVEEGGVGFLVDPHGAVALHVAVTAHRTEPGPRLANLAAHQVQVDDLANGVDRVLVLGDPHGPAADHALAPRENLRRPGDLLATEAGLRFDVCPLRGLHLGQVVVKVRRVLLDKGEIDAPPLLLQDVLRHAANGRHVTAELGREVLVADGGGRRGQQLRRALGACEALEGHLFQVV